MKKFLLALISVSVLFALVACNNGTKEPAVESEAETETPANTSATVVNPDRGVYGLLTGIVVDSYTAAPVEGVTVTIEGTNYKTVTGADGAYYFAKVPVGTYKIGYSKDGFRAQVSDEVTVNATQFLDDDPFYKKAVIDKLLELAESAQEWESAKLENGTLGSSSITKDDAEHTSEAVSNTTTGTGKTEKNTFDFEWFVQNIDNYEYLELLPEITGIYDPCTKSGLLSFDNDMVKNESLKKDIYFIFRFIPNNNISELFAEIFIDSKNESLFNLQKSQYIRGSLNLNNREKIQKKTFYIKFEEDYKYSSVNNTHILEFSSNLENIKPIFNNDFNYFNNITIGGVEKYYFSTENLTKGYIYNFTIQLNNLSNNKSLNNIGRPFYFANYIIKFYEEKYDNNFDFIIDKSYDHKNISNGAKQISYCNFSIKSNNLNFNLNEKNNYTYFVRLYYKQLLFHQLVYSF